MGSRRTGTLFCGLMALAVSTVSAEGRDWSVGWVMRTSVTETITMAMPYRRYPSETFIDRMSKPFASLAMSSVAASSDAYPEFRRPDADIALPKAFRRPQQVTIGFSFRF